MAQPLHTAVLSDLADVYRDADALFDGWSCDRSTECCRFGITGREPYVTSVELLMLETAAARRPSRRPAKEAEQPRRLPVLAGRDEGRCPFLGDQDRCTVYEARPLGCRTFYCDRAISGAKVPHARVVALVRRVQAISIRLGHGADVGRPLRSVVKPARRRRRP